MCCAFLLQQRHPLGVYVPGAAYDAVQVYAAAHPSRATIAIAAIEKTLRHDLRTNPLGNG